MDYITTEELDRFLLGAGAADTDKKEFAVTAASRMFDRLCGVADDYFAEAGDSPSNKVINGTGLTILPLPPFVDSLGSVIYEDGTSDEETVDSSYYKLKGQYPYQILESVPFSTYDAFRPYLYQRDDSYYRYLWRLDKNYTVSAKWGFAAVPDDVKTAVIQIAISLIRDLDVGKADTLGAKEHPMNHFPPNSFGAMTVRKYKPLSL